MPKEYIKQLSPIGFVWDLIKETYRRVIEETRQYKGGTRDGQLPVSIYHRRWLPFRAMARQHEDTTEARQAGSRNTEKFSGAGLSPGRSYKTNQPHSLPASPLESFRREP
ncbi:MAG: hypothetical protein DMG06_06205 [Acidobacteria bacterium]|nr:MAG: hypothetical protein DMG06_06205 [Acidobacteriota bacterium]